MDIGSFKSQYYFFKLENFGRVFVFVDFGNVRPWAKELWPEENKFHFCAEVDIEKLAKVCDWVKPAKKFFYYGHYPKMEKLPHEHEFNKRHRSSLFRIDKADAAGFKVRSKEIKMIPCYDESGRFIGKRSKCNFDVEMCMDMLMKMNKYDTILLFSGDSDFRELLNHLKTKGKKIVIVCTRSRMSWELQGVADKFIPAETLARFLKYEKKQHSAGGGGVNTIPLS